LTGFSQRAFARRALKQTGSNAVFEVLYLLRDRSR
jgi:hypothetical protein